MISTVSVPHVPSPTKQNKTGERDHVTDNMHSWLLCYQSEPTLIAALQLYTYSWTKNVTCLARMKEGDKLSWGRLPRDRRTIKK